MVEAPSAADSRHSRRLTSGMPTPAGRQPYSSITHIYLLRAALVAMLTVREELQA